MIYHFRKSGFAVIVFVENATEMPDSLVLRVTTVEEQIEVITWRSS